MTSGSTAAQAAEQALGGRVGYALLHLSTGQAHGYRQDEVFASASTYKLALLLHVARLVEEGHCAWSDELQLTDELKSWGTGVLKLLSAGLRISVQDTCTLMTSVSDNTATDLLVHHFGLESVNGRLRDLGFQHTRLVAQTPLTGGPNRAPLAAGQTTPAEMLTLLRGIVQGQWLNAENTTLLHGMLRSQQDHTMIPRFLPASWTYAGKTGANQDLRADVGFLTTPDGHAYLLSLYAEHPANTNWTPDSPGTLCIAHLARRLLPVGGHHSLATSSTARPS